MNRYNVSGQTVAGLVSDLSLESVQGEYYSTKAYVCCNIPNYASYMWVWSVTLGWLSLSQALACCGQIVLLDRLPEIQALCSCACIRPFLPWQQRWRSEERESSTEGRVCSIGEVQQGSGGSLCPPPVHIIKDGEVAEAQDMVR